MDGDDGPRADDPCDHGGPRDHDASSDRTADELAWRTTASEIDYSCPGFEVRRDEVVFPDGSEGEFHSVEEPPAVVVLPFTPDGEVVAIEEWRQAVGRVNRGLPAGSVEPGDEDPAAAARRELAEETGYEAETVEHLQSIEPTNGILDAVHHHFVARSCEPTAGRDLDENESIRVETAAYDDLVAAAVDGDLRDGRAVLALLYYELVRR